jgi:murein DD-endopeptidase MepM/ murein hydrolase activator NlpD
VKAYSRSTSTRKRMARRALTSSLAAMTLVLMLSACGPSAGSPTRTPLVAGPSSVANGQLPVKPTSTPGPFQIELPVQHGPPVSGWRPPLYQVPWAISPHDHFYFTRPIAADEINWPLPSYRYGGVFIENVVHTGVDIDAPYGTQILAAGSGTVVWADWGLFLEAPGALEDPYGMAVVLRMDFGHLNQPLYSVYAHMSKIIALRGQHVDTGDVLGLVGATGATTGPHVHFEVRWAENSFHSTYNPELWMAPPEGWGVIVGRITDERSSPLRQLDVRVENTATGEAHYVRTYGPGAVNSDPYYQENMVLGDVPSGLYKITFDWKDFPRQEWMYVYPGQVTYFTFRGKDGFKVGPPPSPRSDSFPTPPSG